MHINPAIRKDDLGRFTCLNKGCRVYGVRGKSNIGVNGFSGPTKRFRQLICKECGKTFSENKGTPFYGMKSDREKIVRALKMIVERGSMRGAARAIGVDKDTVCKWVRKSSEHAESLNEYMLHDLHMSVVEIDELWTTVKKSRSTSWKRTTAAKTR